MKTLPDAIRSFHNSRHTLCKNQQINFKRIEEDIAKHRWTAARLFYYRIPPRAAQN